MKSYKGAQENTNVAFLKSSRCQSLLSQKSYKLNDVTDTMLACGTITHLVYLAVPSPREAFQETLDQEEATAEDNQKSQ